MEDSVLTVLQNLERRTLEAISNPLILALEKLPNDTDYNKGYKAAIEMVIRVIEGNIRSI